MIVLFLRVHVESLSKLYGHLVSCNYKNWPIYIANFLTSQFNEAMLELVM